ncbi:MAG TPA: phosphoserine phosphatase SerB [Actinomycetes bacterium]|nr:phosphoserine phosphatase SerB [Actinomycetes bacterium]
MPPTTSLPPTEVSFNGPTLLITLSGADRPGVSRSLFGSLAKHPVIVVDVEQVVIRGQLILATLIAPDTAAPETALSNAVETARETAEQLGMDITVVLGEGDLGTPDRDRVHVTILGAPLHPGALSALTSTIADHQGNIDRIERLAAYPVTALELDVSGADPSQLRSSVTEQAALSGVDIAVQRTGLQRRAKRLIVMDVDSTLIQGEVIEMLAVRAGCGPEVAAITASSMAGELDFEDSLRRRVKLLAGLPESTLLQIRDELELAPGARTLIRTLKRLGFRCGIVSGGFTTFTRHLASELRLDYSAANQLEVRDGALTGQLTGPIIDRAGKATALREFAQDAGVTLEQTVAIGDGANDLDMLSAAGLGIAFNAKPLVQQHADTAVNVPYLDSILFLLGISREEIESADLNDS